MENKTEYINFLKVLKEVIQETIDTRNGFEDEYNDEYVQSWEMDIKMVDIEIYNKECEEDKKDSIEAVIDSWSIYKFVLDYKNKNK